jgi:hypothetical protein
LLFWFDFGNFFFFFSSLLHTHMTSSHGIRVLVYFFLLLPCEREWKILDDVWCGWSAFAFHLCWPSPRLDTSASFKHAH